MIWPEEVTRDPRGQALLESDLIGEDIDRATARLYREIVMSDRYCRLLPQDDRAPWPLTHDVRLVVMPGAFHREHPHTGADGRRVIELATAMGCRFECVQVGSFDRLHTNAMRLIDLLNQCSSERVILVSLSKGSADVKVALGLAPELFSSVTAWISFSGILNGTPLVAWLRRRPLRWWGVRAILLCRRQSIGPLLELRHNPDGPLHHWPPLPPHLRLIQVLGFPLQRHLHHRWAARGHARLIPLGPNDGGGILLTDALRCPGEIYPVWGADHYLQPAWDIHALLMALMRTALDHASRSATTAITAPANRSSA